MHACIDAVRENPGARTFHIQNEQGRQNRWGDLQAEAQRPGEGELGVAEGNLQLLLGGGCPNRRRLFCHLELRAWWHRQWKAGARRAAGIRRIRHRVPDRALLLSDRPDHVPGDHDLPETGAGLPEELAIEAPVRPELSLRLHCFHAGFLLRCAFLRAERQVQEHLVPCLHCHLFACHFLCSGAVSSLC